MSGISKKNDFRGFKAGDHFKLIGCTLIFKAVKLSHAAETIPCVTGITLDGTQQTTARALDIERPTPGELAYTIELEAKPLYHDGTKREPWHRLSEIARWSWERNPTPRWTKPAATQQQEI